MIPFDFEYYRPADVEQALQNYQDLQACGKQALFFSGGTEFISLARLGQIQTDAVIDLKAIAACQTLESQSGKVTIGSAVSLTRLVESNIFPLLCQHAIKIADHTSRNRITIGGNIAGSIPYREAVLPLLVCDCQLVIARKTGLAAVSIHDIFQQQLRLNPGEFLVQIIVTADQVKLPFVSLKKTRFSKIDYPLVSVAAVMENRQLRVAVSGVCAYPFRSKPMEEVLNDHSLPLEQRLAQAMQHLPAQITDNFEGSREYRKFVLRNTLQETVTELGGMNDNG